MHHQEFHLCKCMCYTIAHTYTYTLDTCSAYFLNSNYCTFFNSQSTSWEKIKTATAKYKGKEGEDSTLSKSL